MESNDKNRKSRCSFVWHVRALRVKCEMSSTLFFYFFQAVRYDGDGQKCRLDKQTSTSCH